MTAKITLPWIDRDCSPNSRGHWKKLYAARKRRKHQAWLIACQMPNVKNKPIPLKITFYPPDRRGYDLDNCLASLKGDLDCISMRLGIDDKNFKPITIDFGPVTKGGAVEINFLINVFDQ